MFCPWPGSFGSFFQRLCMVDVHSRDNVTDLPRCTLDKSQRFITDADVEAAFPGAIKSGDCWLIPVPQDGLPDITLHTKRCPSQTGPELVVTDASDNNTPGTFRHAINNVLPGGSVRIDIPLVDIPHNGTFLNLSNTSDTYIYSPSGATVQGNDVGANAFEIEECDNICVENIRFYKGEQGASASTDALRIADSRDVWVSNCAMAFAGDESLAINACDRILIDHCIAGFSLPNGGGILGPLIVNSNEVILYRNLFAHVETRPELHDGTYEIVANVMYNIGAHPVTVGSPGGLTTFAAIYDNYSLAGPNTQPANFNTIRARWPNTTICHQDNMASKRFIDTPTVYPFVISSFENPPVVTILNECDKNPCLTEEASLDDIGTTNHDLVEATFINDATNGTGQHIETETDIGYYPI